MRRIYIYQSEKWPEFTWDDDKIMEKLIRVRHKQGRLIGRMEGLGFRLREEANLKTLTADVIKSSEIEGEILDRDQVRSSIARRLGMDVGGLIPSERHVDGVVEMMLDATQNYREKLSKDRLFNWHAALFPTGRSGMLKIVVGNWRDNPKDDPMQVISGPLGKERVHFQAPDAEVIEEMMARFIHRFNTDKETDAVLRAAIAHLWFVTVHPFEDGNGRIARAIADMQLARADETDQRFYSMSSQIRREQKQYYEILEKTQQNSLDITAWIRWFLGCLERALDNSAETLSNVLDKAAFWDEHAQVVLNDRQIRMINMLFDGFEGKLTSSKWAKINKCSQDTAGRDINELISKGILEKALEGGRSTNYLLIKSAEGNNP